MPIHPYVEPGEFDPEVIDLLGRAFDAVCQEMNYQASRIVLEVVADRIVAAARDGERDLDRLRAAGIAGLPRAEE